MSNQFEVEGKDSLRLGLPTPSCSVGMSGVEKTERKCRKFNEENSGQWKYLRVEELELKNRESSDHYENVIIPLFKRENPQWESDSELREQVFEMNEIVIRLRKPLDREFIKTSSWNIDIYSLKYGESSLPYKRLEVEPIPVHESLKDVEVLTPFE